jgi:hypothetical protein
MIPIMKEGCYFIWLQLVYEVFCKVDRHINLLPQMPISCRVLIYTQII